MSGSIIRLQHSVSKSIGVNRVARKSSNKQNMQKDMVSFSTADPLSPGEEVVLATLSPDQEILVKRVLLHIYPEKGSGFASGEGAYTLAVTESDNGTADPSDWNSPTRLVRSTIGSVNSLNQIDTVLTMRKEGQSGIHAVLRNGYTDNVSFNGQLVIHYLEV